MSTPALPPVAWLRAFEAAARHLSFTAAAAELHLTQSAVSQHVRSLETFFGRPMFVRGPRALSLTEDGTNYLPAVREAFAALVAGAQPFAGSAGPERARTVTLQCNMGFAALRLVPRLGAFAEAHPELRLNIVTPVWDPERTARMADVEIRFARPDGAGQDGLRLTRERAYPVCVPGVAARIEAGDDWRALPLFDCAGVLSSWQGWLAAHEARAEAETEAGLAAGLAAGAAGARAAPPALPGVHMASTFAVSIGAALAGAGLAMAHDGLVADALAAGRLVRPFGTAIAMPECYVLFQSARHMRTHASGVLVDWLVAEFADPRADIDSAAASG